MHLTTLHQLLFLGIVGCQEFLDLKEDVVCPRNKSYTPVSVDRRYIVASLSRGHQHNLTSNCNIFLKVKEKGWGLMVYVESMYLRGQEDQCVDYIQFGKDDLVPFITLVRSKKMCGEVNNWSFDVDNGAMNIWMQFGDNRPNYHREKLAVVHLKMIITPYKKTKSDGLKKCFSPGHYVRESFFCDNYTNCAMDNNYKGPRDESDEICTSTTSTTTTTTTTPPPTYPTIQTTYINIGFESEDLRLGTIISVSLGVLISLACCMVCCVKRCSRVSLPSTPTSDPDECHEMRLSGLPASQQHRMLSRGGLGSSSPGVAGSAAPSVYSDTADLTASQLPSAPHSGDPVTVRGETPPPAYTEIFPEGYQPKQLSTNLIAKDSASASTDV